MGHNGLGQGGKGYNGWGHNLWDTMFGSTVERILGLHRIVWVITVLFETNI